jgi:uncharacterized protein (TIGR02145 family)
MMKKNNQFLISTIILIGLLLLTGSCKKDDNGTNNGKSTAVFNSQLSYGTMTDQDGNTYKTIKIGTQTWMAENLRTTKYRNGDAIPEVTGEAYWKALSTEDAYCNINNTTNRDTIATFGRLYNWYAVSDIRNIAPAGWHVPSVEEWNVLTDYLGGGEVAGGKLKEIGTTHWTSPNEGATNETGFTALPGSNRSDDGVFYSIGSWGIFWTSSELHPTEVFCRSIRNERSWVYNHIRSKNEGNSVRCVKD